MSRPILAQLDLQALKDNLQIVRRAAPGSRVWSVVKANAYGHGIDRIWSALGATDGFALLNLEEAILLRERGWKGPILLLEGFFHAQDLPLLDKYRLTTSVHSNWQIKAIQDAKLHAPLDIYLKVNSGMNRLGFQPERVHTVWQQLRALKNVGEMTLMAHFADAEKPDGIADAMVRIEQAAEGLDCPRSLSNSAATLWHPEAHYNWVRPGIVLYGASPSGQWQDIANSGLKPVMTLRSEIIGVQTLKAGDTVGYGSRYRAAGKQRIGIVAGGYADGYPRIAPSGTPVWVDGVRTGTVGTVSMDMLAIDLTPCPQAGIGSPVELWGTEVKIDDVAAAAGTVGYELMCALAPRVPVVTV
ncbi:MULTISPECIES: catabolic alanine racemase DadX [Enterobacter cloacae complex]|uniref:catabolic alanine racemase DadX n=1 Tax=Enterobacter cloacae complex TaxID=354276 RepID=UPI0005F08353|nr:MULTISPECIES: catabolic alanine racemase DadX [Enterobacter cloacae complex]AVU51138.1 alanine racemase [Enterobacter cloacae]EHE7810010.1 catabolic alanine racemase DadX [Enterobacter hormaechei]EHF3574343.1 catabolic alanine racemase DadX [Enterobacter hormaechei]KJL69918.1 alanine racemase [Enterobacter hormaechei subsp. xiangfangensis]KJM75532.1 alanine racemase [Enterobacter hormaechei subsp. xiangfangensis]